MTIAFSSRNQEIGHHGRKEHAVWYHRRNGTSLFLGTARFTTYRKWCCELDTMEGWLRFFEADSLHDLRRQVRQFFAHYL